MRIWQKKSSRIQHINVILLALQVLFTGLIGFFAYNIQEQNLALQKALYDFEPQVSGFVNGIIWVYQHSNQANATIEILINAPRTGNFTLYINQFYPQRDYLDPDKLGEDNVQLENPIRDTTYPQAYRFLGTVNLFAYIYPRPNMTGIEFFNAGVLEFGVSYWDVSRTISYAKLFNGSVWFQFMQ